VVQTACSKLIENICASFLLFLALLVHIIKFALYGLEEQGLM
jgi:hypothetical protein